MKTLWLIPITLLAFVAHVTAAQVSGVQGEAQLLRNGQPTPLKKGIMLKTGDTFIAGAEAEVRLGLSDTAGELVLSPGGALRLDKLEHNQTGIETIVDASITLLKGDLHGTVGRLSDLSKFEITLGSCRHQVGVGKVTRFALSADGTLRVRSGCLTSICEGRSSHSVCAGEKYVPSLGLVVAMTAPELASPIWDVAQTGGNPPASPDLGNPTVFVNPLIGASISPSAPPAP